MIFCKGVVDGSPYTARWRSHDGESEVKKAKESMTGQAEPLFGVCRQNFSSAPRESRLGGALLGT